jgi:TRAP-type C4-dicarboxylate transport system substrate-binding protein
MRLHRMRLLALVLALVLGPRAVEFAAAHGVTLKVEHGLPADSPFHTNFLVPWTQKLEKESGGRLHFHLQPAVQGAGPLFDRVKAGDADLVWAAIDAAPGRFAALEAFELPFMANSPEGSSRALWEYARMSDQAHRDLDGMRALAIHQSPPPQFHLRSRPVASAADLSGLEIAASSRIERDFVAATGASAVALAPSQMTAALAKGEVDGLLLPWEALPAVGAEEVVRFHSEIDCRPARLFSAVYVLAMNAAIYKSLPDDLKKVFNANGGAETSAWLATVLDDSAAAARKRAADSGHAINVLTGDTMAQWQRPAQSAIDAWIKELDGRGVQGKELMDSARESLAEYDRAK